MPEDARQAEVLHAFFAGLAQARAAPGSTGGRRGAAPALTGQARGCLERLGRPESMGLDGRHPRVVAAVIAELLAVSNTAIRREPGRLERGKQRPSLGRGRRTQGTTSPTSVPGKTREQMRKSKHLEEKVVGTSQRGLPGQGMPEHPACLP